MKKTKIVFFALVLAVLVALTGCYKFSEESTTPAEGDQVSYVGEQGVSSIDNVSSAADAVAETKEEATLVKTETSATTEPAKTTPASTEAKAAEPSKPVATAGEISAYEGELVQLKVRGTDPDGDVITYTFSAPFDKEGKWQTKIGDAGDYSVTVTASDGKTQTAKTMKVKIIAKNAAPVMEKIADISIKEGDTITLSPKVVDPDGDTVTTKYSGWMTTNTKTTGYNDSGDYTVTITASDGKLETSQNVKVHVADVNRAPEFEIVVS